jgi:acylphosphatase
LLILIAALQNKSEGFSFKQSAINKSAILTGMTSTEKTIEARRFVVRGRVQGVGFRWFVEREAHVLGISGWVRNNSDGSVEVLAQGTRDQISGLQSRLRQGPRAARVDSVDQTEVRPSANISSFRIEGAW